MHIKNQKLDFHDFNSKTYDELVNYLKSRNYSINYIGTILNKLKTILKASHEEGLHNNSDYQKNFITSFMKMLTIFTLIKMSY